MCFCEGHLLKAQSASLKSEVSCVGRTQLLYTTASFETVAYWAVQSFTLGRAVSITTDCLGIIKKAKRRTEEREEDEIAIKLYQFVCDNTKEGGTSK